MVVMGSPIRWPSYPTWSDETDGGFGVSMERRNGTGGGGAVGGCAGGGGTEEPVLLIRRRCLIEECRVTSGISVGGGGNGPVGGGARGAVGIGEAGMEYKAEVLEFTLVELILRRCLRAKMSPAGSV